MEVIESVEGKTDSIFLHLTCPLHFRFDCRCVLWYHDYISVMSFFGMICVVDGIKIAQ